MNTMIRDATPEDASAMSTLVQSSFKTYVAQDWEPIAQESLLTETTAEKLAARISESSIALVHEENEELLGVILLPRPNLVQLCFVAPGHLRRGIASALWHTARTRIEEQYPEIKTVELNSTPYAFTAYQALGFYPISKPFRRHGSVATRMACWLPGKALAAAQNAA